MAPMPHLHPELTPVLMTVLALLVGLAAQVLANRTRLPSIIFLLLGGIGLGPSVLGLVQPGAYGQGLRSLVALCVAVIVFEGALLIDLPALKNASRAVLGLVSIGVIVTAGCAAVLAHALVGLAWEVSCLFGALVSVTGPTVITPILARLALSPNLRTTLEAESVMADAIGVMLAAMIFTFVTGARAGPTLVLGGFLLVAALGATLAVASYLALRALAPLPGSLVRLWVLATALATYVCAELVTPDAGIMAVVVAGIVLGSLPLPYEESIKQFKGDLTVLSLSLVFILLAANLPLAKVFTLGWPAVAVALLLMGVVRPLAVAAATWGSELTWREKAFLAALAPRGIVAASAATFFALALAAHGVAGADALAGLVFVVVVLTVVIEGAAASLVARALGVVPPRVVILGGDRHARRLAQRLQEAGELVQLLDDDLDHIHALLARELPAELCSFEELGHPELACAKRLVVATADDQRNLELARRLREVYPHHDLHVRLEDETRRDALVVLGAHPWPVQQEPLLPTFWNAAIEPEAALEIPVEQRALAGRSLASLDLPSGMVVAMVKRAGRTFVPDGDTCLHLGDVLVVLGDAVAVGKARVALGHVIRRWPQGVPWHPLRAGG